MRKKDLSDKQIIMCDRCGFFELIGRHALPDPKTWKMVNGFRLCTNCEFPKKVEENGLDQPNSA